MGRFRVKWVSDVTFGLNGVVYWVSGVDLESSGVV